MTDPDVKNLRKLVKRARHLANVKAMEKTLEWYARLQRDLTSLNESQRPVSLYEYIGRHARRVRDWANR